MISAVCGNLIGVTAFLLGWMNIRIFGKLRLGFSSRSRVQFGLSKHDGPRTKEIDLRYSTEKSMSKKHFLIPYLDKSEGIWLFSRFI
jgi:hypothetical protein